MEDLPELLVADAGVWRSWLEQHHDRSTGVWLVLAKTSTVAPTSLTYDQALDEALCLGWIDGTLGRRDEATYRQRFTPRRARSRWSQRNIGIVERLEREGRMHPAGSAAVERARADGRWDVAYAGQSTAEVPDDLAAALEAEPRAAAMFAVLTKANRYSVLYRIETARRPETRTRRITELVAMLARGDTVHPQKRGIPT
jgi:uncharacterized protein YdeI (YjbR/CyaY-like superfamily)